MLKTRLLFDGVEKELILNSPKVKHLKEVANHFREAGKEISPIDAMAVFVEVLAVEYDGRQKMTPNEAPLVTASEVMEADAVSFKEVATMLDGFLTGF